MVHIRGESRLVYTVVDIIVGPIVVFFNLLPEVFWEKVDLLVLFVNEMIKLGVEHS